ncbi:hypothetical protein FB451DRAFT_1241067 [Mycena latifolia]|nr:hypothetical protein FB451DRAFT_1241067 [Mycena latifolia]
MSSRTLVLTMLPHITLHRAGDAKDRFGPPAPSMERVPIYLAAVAHVPIHSHPAAAIADGKLRDWCGPHRCRVLAMLVISAEQAAFTTSCHRRAPGFLPFISYKPCSRTLPIPPLKSSI